MKTRSLQILTLAACLAGSGPVAAQFLKRTGMPDYDQKRTTLPNDGRMYCVPTSSVNLLRYMAWHGMPNQDKSYGATYSQVTSFISHVGAAMATDPETGTTGSNSWPALKNWIWDHDGGNLIFQYFYGRDWSWGIGTIKNWQMAGAIARMGYGRYVADTGGYRRDSGHSITLAGVDFAGTSKRLWVCDPASDDEDWTRQGLFTIDGKFTSNLTYYDKKYGFVTHARYTSWSGDNGNWFAAADSMHVIQPVYAGWPFTGRNTTITTIMPWQFTDTSATVPSQYSMSTSFDIVDWVYDVGDFGIWLLGASGKIYYHDLHSNTTTYLTGVTNAKLIGVGGTTADLYLILNTGGFDTLVKREREDGSLTQYRLPGKVTVFDYDDTTRRVALLGADGATVYSMTEDLTDLRVERLSRLTNAIPFGSVPSLFKVDQENGDYLVANRGGTAIERFRKEGGKRLGEIQNYRVAFGIRSFTPFSNGLVVIQDGDTLYSYDKEFLPTQTQFSGIEVEGDVKMSRSQALAKVEEMIGKEWADVLPNGANP
ncbi:MAG: hypothetical protein HONBIEJF_00726 [Fimbriimonadaceae bacterium]|nr:hypothetical protein [Fimbriimonadaceae bacterium]